MWVNGVQIIDITGLTNNNYVPTLFEAGGYEATALSLLIDIDDAVADTSYIKTYVEPVQWNFTISAPTYGLQNVTFWWNNGTTDMGNTTIAYTGSPTSANALFNGTMPSTAENVTFQCWAYNTYTYGTTGVRWMLVYPSSGTAYVSNNYNPYFLNLGTAISTVENANS
mgnify:CR=1 FL=1